MPKINEINIRDLSKAIYKMRDEEPKKLEEGTVYFVPIGREIAQSTLDGEIIDDGYPITNNPEEACAKIYDRNNLRKYFIKVDKYNRIFNPYGMYSEHRANNRQILHAGVDELNFRETNKKAFLLYLNFLKTKNLAWLRNAEQEMI